MFNELSLLRDSSLLHVAYFCSTDSLESPCLSHVGIEQESHNTATGHALTVSATLLHQRPRNSSYSFGSQSDWQVSATGIERLLQLSGNIPLDGEATPVQVWDFIRRHPKFEDLQAMRLEQLKDTLSKHLTCHG